MAGLTKEEKQMALIYAENGADFMFISTPQLCNLIINGDSRATKINKTLVSIILSKQPIRLDSRMIIEYCKGTLDKNNKWLFDQGHIKVVPARLEKPKLVRSKEDNDRKEN